MNIEFHWERPAQPPLRETLVPLSCSESAQQACIYRGCQFIKICTLWHCNPGVHGFGIKLQPARSRESHSPYLVAQDQGSVEKTSLSVVASTRVGEAGELERLAIAHHLDTQRAGPVIARI